jgi:hypothetical protein
LTVAWGVSQISCSPLVLPHEISLLLLILFSTKSILLSIRLQQRCSDLSADATARYILKGSKFENFPPANHASFYKLTNQTQTCDDECVLCKFVVHLSTRIVSMQAQNYDMIINLR